MIIWDLFSIFQEIAKVSNFITGNILVSIFLSFFFLIWQETDEEQPTTNKEEANVEPAAPVEGGDPPPEPKLETEKEAAASKPPTPSPEATATAAVEAEQPPNPEESKPEEPAAAAPQPPSEPTSTAPPAATASTASTATDPKPETANQKPEAKPEEEEDGKKNWFFTQNNKILLNPSSVFERKKYFKPDFLILD